MKRILFILRFCMAILFSISFLNASSQFVPVAINGYNQDVVAEAGTSSLTTTTSALDGTTISNKVIYTETFRTLNAFGGGGIPDNGIITDADGTYQLGDYTANNALIVQRNQTRNLNITTPAKYDHLRLLCFSTEGTSLLNINLFFDDGTSTLALPNYSLGDWFNNTTNLVISGIGRCTRATPASGADAFPDNPRMYYIDIPLSCTDRQKNLDSINIANVTTAGTNAPFPNAVFFAVSATTYSQSITEDTTSATCTTAGAVTLGISGSSTTYNVTWNTTPVQNGLTATNLAAGDYIATITDDGGCITFDTVTIAGVNDLNLTAHIDTTVCFGVTFNANTISNGTGFTWTPPGNVSNPNIANPILSPVGPVTPYTVTATLGTCSTTKTFNVRVEDEITLTVPGTTTICSGSSFTPEISSNGTTFQWSPTTGVSNPNIANPVLSPTVTTDYTVTAFIGNCSLGKTFSVIIGTGGITVNAGDNVTIAAGQSVQLHGSGPAGTYTWAPPAGLSATNILDPVASPSVTTTYTLTIVTAQGCGSDDVIVEVIPGCAKPMNAISPNGDGINDKWLVTNGNCIKAAKVNVYNRYGSSVFSAENYQNDWQGTYKGKTLPDGTYYYVIQYKVDNGNTVTLKGNVTIIR